MIQGTNTNIGNVKFTTIPVTITIPVERVDSSKRKTKSKHFPARKDFGIKKEFIMHFLSSENVSRKKKKGQMKVTARVLFYIKG